MHEFRLHEFRLQYSNSTLLERIHGQAAHRYIIPLHHNTPMSHARGGSAISRETCCFVCTVQSVKLFVNAASTVQENTSKARSGSTLPRHVLAKLCRTIPSAGQDQHKFFRFICFPGSVRDTDASVRVHKPMIRCYFGVTQINVPRYSTLEKTSVVPYRSHNPRKFVAAGMVTNVPTKLHQPPGGILDIP